MRWERERGVRTQGRRRCWFDWARRGRERQEDGGKGKKREGMARRGRREIEEQKGSND